MSKVLYIIPQVADMANVSKSTIYREIAANRLQATMVRSKIRIANDAFDSYIQLCKKM
jgi:excisionase family DNA binding protein